MYLWKCVKKGKQDLSAFRFYSSQDFQGIGNQQGYIFMLSQYRTVSSPRKLSGDAEFNFSSIQPNTISSAFCFALFCLFLSFLAFESSRLSSTLECHSLFYSRFIPFGYSDKMHLVSRKQQMMIWISHCTLNVKPCTSEVNSLENLICAS